MSAHLLCCNTFINVKPFSSIILNSQFNSENLLFILLFSICFAQSSLKVPYLYVCLSALEEMLTQVHLNIKNKDI